MAKKRMKEVDRFFPDEATVVVPKKWRIYLRAAATPEGKVMIERVHPAVGETVKEQVFPLDELDDADADRLVAEIIAAKAQNEARKAEVKNG